jgi:hypothetical protein
MHLLLLLLLLQAKVTQDRRGKSSIIEQYADYGSALYAPPQRLGHFPDAVPAASAAKGSSAAGAAQQQNLTAAMFSPSSIASMNDLEASLPRRTLQPQLRKPQPQPTKATYSQRVQAAAQQDVETIHDMLQAAKAATGARGIGQAWPCPLDDGPAAAAALAAAAAVAAAEGRGRGSRHGLRSAGVGSLSAAAAAAAAAAGASGVRASVATRGAGKPASGECERLQSPASPGVCALSADTAVMPAAGAGMVGSSSTAAVTEAPPLPDADGRHAALVLLQRLLRGRAVQNEMYAGKQAHLPLIRELRLGMEGTGGGCVEEARGGMELGGLPVCLWFLQCPQLLPASCCRPVLAHAGCQPRPEARDATTQERDAAVGAALCRLCCLLTSGDEAGIAQVLQAAAEQRQHLQQLDRHDAAAQQEQHTQPPDAAAECLAAGGCSWSNDAAAQQEGEQEQEQPPDARLVAAAEEEQSDGDGSTAQQVAHTEEQGPDAELVAAVEGLLLAAVQSEQQGQQQEQQQQEQQQHEQQQQDPERGVGEPDEGLDQQTRYAPEEEAELEQGAGAPGGGGVDEPAAAGGGGDGAEERLAAS